MPKKHFMETATSPPMERSERSLTRRKSFIAAGFGAMALVGVPGELRAADWSDQEKANVHLVNDFCAAWPAHNLDAVMAFFSENCAYRVTEAQEPNRGRQAVTDRIKSFLERVVEFKVLETFAKGPMVFNERIDRFSGGPLKSWHGVGVFFIKDDKIVEWYDYTIAIDRA